MIEVNLSRLHNMIKENLNDVFNITNTVLRTPLSFEFKIFELSTQKDYEEFTAKLNERKDLFDNQTDKLQQTILYGEYLKNLLNDANAKSEVGKKLTHQSYLSRYIDRLEQIWQTISNCHDSSLTPVNHVEMYKSTFTDRNKIYSLTGYVFDANDVQNLRKKINELKSEQRALDDEIAEINQTHIVQVMTKKEFAKTQIPLSENNKR